MIASAATTFSPKETMSTIIVQTMKIKIHYLERRRKNTHFCLIHWTLISVRQMCRLFLATVDSNKSDSSCVLQCVSRIACVCRHNEVNDHADFRCGETQINTNEIKTNNGLLGVCHLQTYNEPFAQIVRNSNCYIFWLFFVLSKRFRK